MPLDELLIAVALCAYTLGALALLGYFFVRTPWLRDVGIPVAILGCVAQFVQLFARWELTHIWPLLNLYGSLSLFTAMSVAIYIGFAFRYRLWFAGGFVLALAAIFLAYGVTWYEGTMPPVPSLQSYWAKIHVPIVVSSYAAFLVAFVFSCIYLVKYYAERALEGKNPLSEAIGDIGGVAVRGSLAYQAASAALADAGIAAPSPTSGESTIVAAAAAKGNAVAQWLQSLPSLAQLDVVVYRAVAIGLPLIS